MPKKNRSDETVFNWIEESLADADQEREQEFREMVEQNRKEEERRKHKRHFSPRPPSNPDELQIGQRLNPPTQAPELDGDGPLPVPETPGRSEPRPAGAPFSASSLPQPVHDKATPQPRNRYPEELFPTEPLPRLSVRSCSRNGVELAFDSRWLNWTPFQTAMPMRCVFTGHTDRANLFARPFVFADRSGGKLRSAADVVIGQGQRVLDTMSPQDVVRALGSVPDVRKPFDSPVAYYVSSEAAHLYLECWTETRDDGITCLVRIPDPQFALDWLARVNGICGREYESLQEDVRRLSTDAWARLPLRAQELLGAWVDFQPRERFELFVADPDIPRKDTGLAGLVLTDHRLIYKKYQKQGATPLNEPATLIASPDPDNEFFDITLRTESGATRLCKLRPDDLERLGEALAGSHGLRLEQAEAAR